MGEKHWNIFFFVICYSIPTVLLCYTYESMKLSGIVCLLEKCTTFAESCYNIPTVSSYGGSCYAIPTVSSYADSCYAIPAFSIKDDERRVILT